VTDVLPSETTARTVLERLPDPVLIVRGEPGAAAGIAWGNAAARDLFRLSLPDAPLEAALRQPKVLEAVDAALADGGVHEVAFETIGVQPRFWHAAVRPLAEGEVFVVLRDETDARRTERMRADFMANASHELRTPLASLSGFVETLRTHAKDDPEARERFLGIMDEQAGRMRRLIDDLLSLSRIEMNEHVRPADEVDLAGVVQDVTGASAPILAARGLAFDVEGPGSLLVAGDYDQLVQVVQNLIDNAVKYSPDGGRIRVVVANVTAEGARAPRRSDTVSLSLLSPDGDLQDRYGAVWVSDEGPGVARQHLPRLSERFYRVEGQRMAGTGLGLAIVKHVVNRHRGGLVVESAEGAGTTFCAYFPATP
jgi:two-component system phosphate regulon sensor histidine kinase PhoR